MVFFTFFVPFCYYWRRSVPKDQLFLALDNTSCIVKLKWIEQWPVVSHRHFNATFGSLSQDSNCMSFLRFDDMADEWLMGINMLCNSPGCRVSEEVSVALDKWSLKWSSNTSCYPIKYWILPYVLKHESNPAGRSQQYTKEDLFSTHKSLHHWSPWSLSEQWPSGHRSLGGCLADSLGGCLHG